jgi:catechol 2,3-dioxygenase-like lactoylglutathione lyase family enzyme
MSLQGRRFSATRAGGDGLSAGVPAGTIFDYGQDSDLVWARYSGGDIRLGHLVGIRQGDALDARYAQLTVSGQTASGHCVSTLVPLPDGRLSLQKRWEPDGNGGTAENLLEEVASAGVLGLGFAATATLRRERTAEFFERVLGLSRADGPSVEADRFVLPDGASFAVTSPRGIPGGRSIGFLVASLDRARERLRAAGVEVGPTYSYTSGRSAHFIAPDGETYELVERLPR